MLFCAAFEPHISSRLCGMADIFQMSKCHSGSGSGEPAPLTLKFGIFFYFFLMSHDLGQHKCTFAAFKIAISYIFA